MRHRPLLGFVLAVIVAACGSGEGEGREGSEGSEMGAAGEAPSSAAASEASVDTPSTEPAGAVEEPAGGSVESEEGRGVAPYDAPDAPESEKPALRNWVLLEFVEPVQEADLEWLRENGFAVDTVMGEKLVRGWIEKPGGGTAIAADPRIARVSTQAR